MRVVPHVPEPSAPRNPFRRFRAAARWQSVLSDGYDLFINCTHWMPPFCHATHGVLLVLFPHYERWSDLAAVPWWKRRAYRLYSEFEWQHRLRSYQQVVSISEFARTWTRRRWNVESTVVYPPVETSFLVREKQPLIVSVGRFNVRAYKKQVELMRAFRDMVHSGFAGWRYVSAGGLNDNAANRAYVREVEELAMACPATVGTNLNQLHLADLLATARIFWHAAGLDEHLEQDPGRAEHFGISTVEAMAAGCVPVVINAGAQPEIVEHGTSGFLWNSVEELVNYTRLLADDPELWLQMSAAARQRARVFSTPRFVREMSALCGVRYHERAAARTADDRDIGPGVVAEPARRP